MQREESSVYVFVNMNNFKYFCVFSDINFFLKMFESYEFDLLFLVQ